MCEMSLTFVDQVYPVETWTPAASSGAKDPHWELPDEKACSPIPERRPRCDRYRIRLIAAGIPVAIIAVVNGLGTSLNTTFSSISSQLK